MVRRPANMTVERHMGAAEVEDERPARGLEHPPDLTEPALMVGPVVHRERGYHEVEGGVRERERHDIRRNELRARADAAHRPLDHRRVEVDRAYREAPVDEAFDEVPGPAPDVQDPGAWADGGRDVVRDSGVEPAEQPAREPVVERNVGDEDAALGGHRLAPCATEDRGRGGEGNDGYDDAAERSGHERHGSAPRGEVAESKRRTGVRLGISHLTTEAGAGTLSA